MFSRAPPVITAQTRPVGLSQLTSAMLSATSSPSICPGSRDISATRVRSISRHSTLLFVIINDSTSSETHGDFDLVAEQLNNHVENQMSKSEDTGRWQCLTCGYEANIRGRLWEHVESSHVVTSGYPCEICHKVYPSKNAYKSHKSRYHRYIKQS